MLKIEPHDTYTCPKCHSDRFVQIVSEIIIDLKPIGTKTAWSQCIDCDECWVNPAQQEHNKVIAAAFRKVQQIMSIEI